MINMVPGNDLSTGFNMSMTTAKCRNVAIMAEFTECAPTAKAAVRSAVKIRYLSHRGPFY